jgi:integrase
MSPAARQGLAITDPRRASRGEQFPVPLGDDFYGAVGHSDGGLVVDRVRRTRDTGRPSLCNYRASTPFAGEDERVFVNPRTGSPFRPSRFGNLLRDALKRAGVEGYIRPCHDLRHSSITNAAAAGTSPEALMSRAGHSDCATTRRYVDLAGERFREEGDRLERRLAGERNV